MKYIIVIVALSLAGCGKPLSYDDYTAKVKWCSDRGVSSESWNNPFSLKPYAVYCKTNDGLLFEAGN